MSNPKTVFCFLVLIFFVGRSCAQQNFYDLNTIQKIEIYFNQPNWDYQMDTANYGSEGYVMASRVKVNGVEFDSVGVKYKGNSSYDSTYIKNPLHIALDEFKNQSYQQLSDIKLGNNYADPSMIREVLSYSILKNYMDCPQSNFAQLFINDNYIGLYSNDESISKDFCGAHFNSKKNTFIKCNPIINPGPATKSNLKFLASADSSAYFNFYEIKSDYGWNDLVALCDSVTNHASTIENTFDMDKVIWMLAFNNVLVNLDSYSGVFCQNYYLYKDATNRYNPIVWDLNMALGGFPFVGNLNNSMGSLTIANMQQLSLTSHATDPYWPLINAVMSNATYKKMYIAHVKTITNEMFADSSYVSTATQLQQLIDGAVQADTNMFFSYAQFQSALIINNTVGSYMVPGIQNLMNARVSYLQSTTEFSASAPLITSIASAAEKPEMFSQVFITAQITNTNFNAVYLGYRYNAFNKFTKMLMLDDGLHNDGAANDNVYGVSLEMNSDIVQYYVYAENANAGIFSPERSEHEYYTLKANSNSAVQQVLVYPNPADNLLTVVSGRNNGMNFEIVNSLGAVIYKNSLTEQTNIETKNWTHGIYFLHLGSTVKKIVVIHL